MEAYKIKDAGQEGHDKARSFVNPVAHCQCKHKPPSSEYLGLESIEKDSAFGPTFSRLVSWSTGTRKSANNYQIIMRVVSMCKQDETLSC